MKLRPPQLPLQLDAAAPDSAARWRDGATLPYLGGTLTLQLDTNCREAQLDGGSLHLPLPPEATPRQIQDAAEAWLRRQAERIIGTELAMAARSAARSTPRFVLSFAARGNWGKTDGKDGLKFHWRLIEQPTPLISQVVARALAELPPAAVELDLFAAAA